MANVLDSDIIASEFDLQLRSYNHFWSNTLGKSKKSFISQLLVE